jgi:hypothetical protein
MQYIYKFQDQENSNGAEVGGNNVSLGEICLFVAKGSSNILEAEKNKKE